MAEKKEENKWENQATLGMEPERRRAVKLGSKEV